ncbi:uncharacterized protein LOC127731593 [Mytilus californianus]|uniref:uncharacterized protein LOC127731593 n=1 Tax=Mytilus californianus TaxID=6549 RepID=UPI002248689E|nr:uncharacterized protein LOC127731593 [Mytilus californianus]XP_052096300.1 uncharacterized protein LOC127731593 [Mytilus californianus]
MTGIWFIVTVLVFVLNHGMATQSIIQNSDMRVFCLMFALPGRKNGPDINGFKNLFDAQLDKVGKNVFGNIPHSKRMEEAGKICTFMDSSSPKCAYHRIATIGNHMIDDLRRLESSIGTGFKDSWYMYTVLLSTWYMDRVFLSLNCGPVNVNLPRPTSQWEYIAKWSKHLLSRTNFCTWSKPLDKTIAQNLRQEVKKICNYRETEPICRLEPVLDFVDSMTILCDIVPQTEWQTSSTNFKFFKSAGYINFYSMRVKMPPNIVNLFDTSTREEAIKTGILSIFFQMYDDFKANDLSLAVKLLKILPKSQYLPCDYNAPFPSFKWLICSCAKVFNELRLFLQTYGKANSDVLPRKFLVSNIDFREYIKNLKVSQIKELAEKNAVSLQVVAMDIKNDVQHRFQQLGTYFKKVATYQKAKLNADVGYLKGSIKDYQTRFNKYVEDIKGKLTTLLGLYIGTVSADLVQAVAKMAIRIAMAGNPFKWLAGSGNTDDILESATEIAEASRLLTHAIRSAVNFGKLVDYSTTIAKKLAKNEKMIKNAGKIMNNAMKIVESSENGFETIQSNFLRDYNDYSPQVTKDDLAKLGSYWELFIEEICEGIASTSSIHANAIRGIAGTTGRCREAKITAAQLVATQEEVYDMQFDLMETMANLMRSLTQIQSSKILGNGPKAQHPSGLSVDTIKTLVAVSSMSYNILQTTNVQMLCNILEYKHGRKPQLCNGLATDIDKLLALRDSECHEELKFITLSTKRTNKTGDFSWLDLSLLFRGETVPFQVPDVNWWMQHGKLLPSQRDYSFYLAGFEIYMPFVSDDARPVLVQVKPTNVDNKLFKDSKTNYIISPLKPISDRLKISYIEGRGTVCRQQGIPNPYQQCGGNQRSSFQQICPSSLSKEDDSVLLPSIYSKFNLRVEGYEQLNLDKPVTDVPLKIGIKFCSVDPSRPLQRRKREISSIRRQRSNGDCCPQNKQYYSEMTKQCESCPVGSQSYYNGLFCGKLINIRFSGSITETFTYAKAVNLCKQSGSNIASTQLFAQARQLGQTSCVCAWLEGSRVDSLTTKNNCVNKTACSTSGNIKFVHCTTNFSH